MKRVLPLGLWYEPYLINGMREQEVMHTHSSDVNFTGATVRVSHKADRRSTPKAHKEREIAIPAKLVGVVTESGD